jgi:hypothetical protein
MAPRPSFPAPAFYDHGGDSKHPFYNRNNITNWPARPLSAVVREGQPSFNAKDYQVVSANAKNVSVAYLYDIYDYPTAGQAQFNFFGRSQNAAGLNITDTNMQQPGNVGAGVQFVVEHIWIEFLPGAPVISAGVEATIAAANQLIDYNKVMAGKGSMQFTVNQVPQIGYGISPLKDAACPITVQTNGGVAAGVAAMQALTAYTMNGGYNTSVLPFMLDETMSFSAQINFPALITVSTLSRIGMKMKGYQIRQAG